MNGKCVNSVSNVYWISSVLLLLIFAFGPVMPSSAQPSLTLLNASYDPTRELYQEINTSFSGHWQRATGQKVDIRMSHGGSGKQARSVIDGLQADVVTLALGYDVDAIASAGLLRRDWATLLPQRAAPYTSAIVFLVRKGNPKAIRDWSDLARPGVEVITPNPRTSGGARWNYLAAWGYAVSTGTDPEAFARRIFANVPFLDTGARGATTSFVERGLGDVYIAWENEALLVTRKLYPGRFELVVPSITMLAEPPVAVVDSVVDKRGTRQVARKYLEFLYSPAGQRIVARHFFRPRNGAEGFAPLRTFTIDRFGGWQKAQADHFADGGSFDRVMAARKR